MIWAKGDRSRMMRNIQQYLGSSQKGLGYIWRGCGLVKVMFWKSVMFLALQMALGRSLISQV